MRDSMTGFSRSKATACRMLTDTLVAWVSTLSVSFWVGKFHYFSSAMLIIGFLSGSFLGQQMQFVELAPSWECSVTSNFRTVIKCVSDANKVP